MKKTIILVFLSILFFSCANNSDNKRFLPNASGSAGELLIVIKNDVWETNVGDTLKQVLAQSQIALPQPEPIFSLTKIPPSGFKNTFMIFRNVIYVNIDTSLSETKISVFEEKWAKNQLIIYLNAPDSESLITLFNENKYKIINKILQTERKRTMLAQKKFEEVPVRQNLIKNHKISLIAPKGFHTDVDSNSFIWISHQTSELDQGLLVYYYPYKDITELDKKNLIKKRNEVLKKYVTGSAEGSYMTTEDLVPVHYNTFYRDNGLFVAEMRGLWKLEKGFMGGPFISHTTVDTIQNRVVTVEGYVFAPREDKRNYLRQVEAILYSLEIIK